MKVKLMLEILGLGIMLTLAVSQSRTPWTVREWREMEQSTVCEEEDSTWRRRMLLHEATKDGGDNKGDDDLTRQSLPGEQMEQIEAGSETIQRIICYLQHIKD